MEHTPITKNSQTPDKEGVTALARGAGVNLIGKLGGRGLHVFAQIALARLFGPAGFGLYSIGWNILRTVGIIAPLGLDNGVIRFGAHYWDKDAERLGRVVSTSVSASIISGGLVGLFFFVASSWLADLFGKPELAPIIRWFSFAFPLASGLKVAASATRITRRMQFGIWGEELGQPLANLALILAFYLAGYGLIGAVGAGTASFFIGLLISLLYLIKLFFPGSPRLTPAIYPIGELLSYSLPTAFAGMFATLILFTDRILVGYFLPETQAGIYQAVSLSSVIFVTILSAFKLVLSPIVAALHQTGKKQRLKEIFQVSTRWGLYISLPILIVIWFAPREIITVLFGQDFESGYPALVVLSISQLVNVGTGAVDQILIMTDRPRDWLRISSIMFAANLVFNLIFIPVFGITGAAIATLITYSGISILGLIRVRYAEGFWPYNRYYLKGILASTAAAASIYLVTIMNLTPSLISLVIMGITSTVVFGVVLLVLGLNSEDFELVSIIRAQFLSR